MSVDEHPVFKHQFQGAREHDRFHIPAGLRHVLPRMGVVHWNYALRDDGAFVEILGGKMRRRADDFYPALVSLPVRICPGEGGQKRMVNVYDAERITRHECFA